MIIKSIETLQNLFKNPKTFEAQVGEHHRLHAKALDRKIGFKSPKIETKLLQKYRAYDQDEDPSSNKGHYQGAQTWIGLHPQALQTTYDELYQALIKLENFNIKNIVDIGAAYGRVGIVGKAIFPTATFTGFEIVRNRQREANRIFEFLELQNCEVYLQNVIKDDFRLPFADIYFLYDFSEIDDICIILDQLSSLMENNNFFIITKGDRLNYLIKRKYKQFWLTNHFIEVGDLKIYSSFVELKS